MVAHATGANFVAIHHHVELVSHDGELVSVSRRRLQRFYTALWHTEWVVPKIKLLAVVVPFIERKINNPGKGHHARVFKVEMSSKFISQATKHSVDD